MLTTKDLFEPNSASSELYEGFSKVNYETIPLYTIFSGLSIIGCIYNVFTTIVLKISKTAMGKMVIALSLMDFIFSSSYMILLI